jgi:hypothetical protein
MIPAALGGAAALLGLRRALRRRRAARSRGATAPQGAAPAPPAPRQLQAPAPLGARDAPPPAAPKLRGGALVALHDARGQGIVAHPTGNGEWWDLASTCAAAGLLRLRVADLGFSTADAVFVVEEGARGLLSFRSLT